MGGPRLGLLNGVRLSPRWGPQGAMGLRRGPLAVLHGLAWHCGEGHCSCLREGLKGETGYFRVFAGGPSGEGSGHVVVCSV
eukprot:490567-Pyramimonas_sp.AAC.2